MLRVAPNSRGCIGMKTPGVTILPDCRPFANRILLPEGAVNVRLRDYVGIAWRMLCGKNGESEIPTKR